MNEKTIFQQYYEIRHYLDTLTIQEKELREQIITELENLPESVLDKSTYKSDFGNFTKKLSMSYSYPTDVIEECAKIGEKCNVVINPIKENIKLLQKPFDEEIDNLKNQSVVNKTAIETKNLSFSYSYKK